MQTNDETKQAAGVQHSYICLNTCGDIPHIAAYPVHRVHTYRPYRVLGFALFTAVAVRIKDFGPLTLCTHRVQFGSKLFVVAIANLFGHIRASVSSHPRDALVHEEGSFVGTKPRVENT